MRIGTILTSLALVLVICSIAVSQTAVRESFEYPAGSVLDGLGTAGNGWGGPWQFYTQGNNPPVPDSPVDSSQIVVNDFKYDEVPYEIPHAGNSISATLANANTEIRYSRWLAQRWPDQAGTTYWLSTLVYLTNVNTTSIWAGVGFYDSVTAAGNGERALLGKGWGDNVFSLGSGAPSADEKSTYAWDVGPVWLVARVDMSGDDSNERFFMWVNTDPAVEPDTTIADVKHSLQGLNGGFTRLAIHFGDYGGLAGLQFAVDEVRLGTSWDDVSSPIEPTFEAIESFDYPVGSVLDGLGAAGNGWGGPWQFYTQGNNPPVPDSPVDSSQIVVNDFKYDEIPYEIPHAGNSISATLANANTEIRYSRWLAQRWPDQAGTTYWLSTLVYLTNVNTTSIWAGVGFYDSVTAAGNGERALLGKGWGDNVFSLGSGAPSADEKSTYAWDVGPVWLVARVDMSGDASNERFFMWVNTDPSVEPDTTIADVKHSLQGLNGGFTRLAIHFGDYGGLAGLQFAVDEVRLGTSWDDVSSPLITSIERKEHPLPGLFVLPQNYPNPFNPSTKISYRLETQDKVRLTVYDLNGRQVAVLVDGVEAAGEHVVSFSGTGLSSGIYFYRLETPKGILVNKMTLIK